MNDALFNATEHLPPVVASVLLAVLASHVALAFADRLRGARERSAQCIWMAAGSVAMGTGIWAMHFVGLSAARFPFAAAVDFDRTAVSWIVAVLASVGFIAGASRRRLSPAPLTGLAVLIGCGVAAMHFTGMSALDALPTFAYEPTLVLAALALAIGGAALSLAVAAHPATQAHTHRALRQFGLAGLFGASLSGVHYLAMAATEVATGTVCRTAQGLPVDSLGGTVGLASATLLVLMLMMTSLQQRSERRAAQLDGSLGIVREELRLVSMTDSVTGLPNRLVFQDRLRQAVARSDRDGTSIAVMFVNIDGFRAVDHSWNDVEGEAVVRRVAERLGKAIRTADTVAAVGGDQFLVMLDGLANLEPAARVAEALRSDPAHVCASTCTLSIGISVYPGDGALSSLVGRASTAAEAAARAGGDCYRFFEDKMNADATERAHWLAHLRLATARGELQLHYQPKFFATSGTMAGVEALLRWSHPTLGPVSPVVFIPLAEKFGLINQLGSWVIEETCRQMQAWADVGIELNVAINVSVFQLRQPGLVDEIVQALRRHGVDPRLLTCEVTESGAMDDTQGSLQTLLQLEAAGIRISIDDFGTGYSSLSYLRRLPVHQLKVDRSFVNDLCDCSDARAVVAAIVQLAHALRLEVVAEGVETACQRDALLALGCDKFQGFLFARPMAAEVLTAQLLAESREHDALTATSTSGDYPARFDAEPVVA